MKKKKRISKLYIFVAVAVVAGVVVALALIRNKTPQTVELPPNNEFSQNAPETYDATSEGHTFPVPKSVQPSAIKNYTLVTENEQFKIRKDGDNYLITLYAVINRPDQYDSYRDQLREYKQNALQFLTDQGLKVDTLHISYEPEEATQL